MATAATRERVTVTAGAAIGLTTAAIQGKRVAVISVEGAMRYTLDGTDPVIAADETAVGHKLADGAELNLHGPDLEAFKAIADTSTGYLEVTFRA